MAHLSGTTAANSAMGPAEKATDMMGIMKTTGGSGMGMGMGGGQMGPMMMGPMMGTGRMMANMPMMAECAEIMGKSAVAAGIASSASSTGSSFAHRLIRNPWVLFGFGVAAGFIVHKYRKEIIAAGAGATEKSKDFVCRQTKNVSDWVTGKEAGEAKAPEEG